MGGQNSADKQRGSSAKARPRGKSFKPGNPHAFKPGDPRINRNGRPKDHAELRALIQELAGEEVAVKGQTFTRLEHLLLSMFRSRSPADRQNVLEHGYGRVPHAITLTLDEQLKQLGINPDEAVADLGAAIAAASAGVDSTGGDESESEADRRNPG